MLNIALPTGRLGNDIYDIFAKLGYLIDEFEKNSRKLVIENKEIGLRYFLVKPSDVGIYVERGIADIGVVGKDVILETEPDIYELLDLGLGKCKMIIAAKDDFKEYKNNNLKVATKYVNITKKYFEMKNREVDIVKLNGSIELAPVLDMSDVIVDITETGTTLRENNLSIIREIVDISAMLIANKSSYKFNKDEIDGLVNKIKECGDIKND